LLCSVSLLVAITEYVEEYSDTKDNTGDSHAQQVILHYPGC